MVHFTCDLCGKDLTTTGEARYVVKIAAYAGFDPTEMADFGAKVSARLAIEPWRIWGLMLSSGAWAGIVLTIGLIRRWGEVFPRWMPLVAGRPVPVWVAAGPGSVVAAILCVSAVPMIRMFATQSVGEAIGSAIIFPLWFWGPALALAVWGYVLHRRQAADVAGTDGAAIR